MDVKGKDAIELLTSQHREVEATWGQLRQAHTAGTGDQRELGQRIVTMLSKHDAIETQFLYPELRDLGDDGKHFADHSLEEHQQIRELLAAVDEKDPAETEVFATFSRLYDTVMSHVQEEENQIFPFMRQQCDADRLRDLGEKMADAWDKAPTHPHPHMPESKIGSTVAGAVSSVIDKARDAMKREDHKD